MFIACGDPNRKEEPSYLLAPEEMVAVLSDVHLSKGKISIWRIRDEVSQTQEDSLIKLVYAKHQIATADFDSSLLYYSLNKPQVLETIYTQVVEKLQKQEANLEN